MTAGRGQVYDIGYQSYEGRREGRSRVHKALWVNGVRMALGVGRGWPSKILPALLFLVLMVPALVFMIAGAAFGDIDDAPALAAYYRGAIIPLIIIGAIIAPELLCADRRNGVINLYLVRPLTGTDYALGRWAAFLSVTLALVYLPQIILMIGLVLGAEDPGGYLRDNWLDIPRFLGAGAAIALFTATLPLAAAAFTTRRAYAAVFVIGLWFIATAASNSLVESIGGGAAKWLALIDIGSAPIFISDMIFGEDPGGGAVGSARELHDAVIAGWYVLVTGGCAAVLWWRYRRLTP